MTRVGPPLTYTEGFPPVLWFAGLLLIVYGGVVEYRLKARHRAARRVYAVSAAVLMAATVLVGCLVGEVSMTLVGLVAGAPFVAVIAGVMLLVAKIRKDSTWVPGWLWTITVMWSILILIPAFAE